MIPCSIWPYNKLLIMKKVFQFLILPLIISSCTSKPQSPIDLFNGKDLEGWYAFQDETGKHENANEIFHVEDQMIRLYGEKAGYLMSEQSFKDFKLTVEFRWNTDSTFSRKNNKKNSGVMYLVPTSTPDTLWPQGIQFQIKEGATGDIILLQNVTMMVKGERTEPGRSTVVKRSINATKPVGEWNTMVITAKNGVIKQELNSNPVNEGLEPSVSEGRVLLQYEGFPIDFRKVVIEKLD